MTTAEHNTARKLYEQAMADGLDKLTQAQRILINDAVPALLHEAEHAIKFKRAVGYGKAQEGMEREKWEKEQRGKGDGLTAENAKNAEKRS